MPHLQSVNKKNVFSSVVTTPNSKIAAVDPISFLNYHRSNMYIIYSIYTYIDPFYLVLMYLLALESLVKYCIYISMLLAQKKHPFTASVR